jgi:hypothetical protein
MIAVGLADTSGAPWALPMHAAVHPLATKYGPMDPLGWPGAS